MAVHSAQIYGLRGGNWSALFLTAGTRTQPQLAVRERTAVYPFSLGYDSQFYHWIAHDPWLTRDLAPFVDTPQLRWRRILVPVTAWAAALGRDRWIDTALLGQQYVWAYLGGFWLGPWFLLVPAVLTSMDRLTVDLAFAALCCGLIFFHQKKQRRAVIAVLALAALTRETGFLLIAAVSIHAARERRWRDAAGMASAALPAVAWYLWLRGQPGAPEWRPVATLALLPSYAGFGPAVALAARALDLLSLAGAAAAVVLSLKGVRAATATLADHAAAVFAVFFVAFSFVVPWFEPFGYVRVCSPMFLFLAMREKADAPLMMVAPRILAQLCFPVWRAARLM